MILAKRARVHRSDTAKIRTWPARDAPYALVEVASFYGTSPPRYLIVELLSNGNQRTVSQHRKRSAAVKAMLGMERTR